MLIWNSKSAVKRSTININTTKEIKQKQSVTKMYTQILEACYYGQMKDYNYEKLRGKSGPHWTNYEYEMMNYLLY